MHAIKIKITGELLLELMGLKVGNIVVYAAHVERPNVLDLVLKGDDERLPEVQDGQKLPEGIIICNHIESKIEIIAEDKSNAI